MQKGISKENLIIKLNNYNNDLVIILKQDGIDGNFSTDKILIKDWQNKNNRIENIAFADGTVMNEVGHY